AEAVDDTVRICAATQLARLAQAGVAGADPAQWYGMTPLSSDEPLWDGDVHAVAGADSWGAHRSRHRDRRRRRGQPRRAAAWTPGPPRARRGRPAGGGRHQDGQD